MNIKFLFSALVVLGLISSQASATSTNVGSYNLILKGDLTSRSDIEGKILVGGINGSTNLDVGSQLYGDPTVDAVTVVGDITGTSFVKALNGNLVYGGGNIGTTTLAANNSASDVLLKDQTSLQSSFDSIWATVEADSAYFASLDETGVLDSSDNNQMVFKNDNSLEMNVFNIDTSNLMTNGGLNLDITPTVPVVINVSGTGIININSKALGDLAVHANASNIVWNFFEADVINFTNGSWFGSILAPNAIITSVGGNINGGVAALSLNVSGELHNYLYSYTPPTPSDSSKPPTEVPTPASLGIIALALLFMVRRKLTK